MLCGSVCQVCKRFSKRFQANVLHLTLSEPCYPTRARRAVRSYSCWQGTVGEAGIYGEEALSFALASHWLTGYHQLSEDGGIAAGPLA